MGEDAQETRLGATSDASGRLGGSVRLAVTSNSLSACTSSFLFLFIQTKYHRIAKASGSRVRRLTLGVVLHDG